MNESWDQSKVFKALVNRGEKIKESPQDRYVQLYHPQPQNTALLYQGSPKAPVHINHRQWSRESWEEIKDCLPYLIWGWPRQFSQHSSRFSPIDSGTADVGSGKGRRFR